MLGACTAMDGHQRTPRDSADDGGLRPGTTAADPAQPVDQEPPSTGAIGEPPADPTGLPTGIVTIGDDVFRVEIAATDEARLRGLMSRESLAPDAGMLFIFDAPRYLSFWMVDTLIPLDIAFIREDLTISSLDTMEPLTRTSHASIEPIPMALEVPAGEFARRGITPGDSVTITGAQ